jgi:hypothetical protein
MRVAGLLGAVRRRISPTAYALPTAVKTRSAAVSPDRTQAAIPTPS